MTPTDSDLMARLRSATLRDPGEVGRLRDGLGRRAAANDLLDVAYRIVDSPVGPLLLAATGTGLVRVAFAEQDFDAVLTQLAEQISPRILRSPHRLDPAAQQLDDYFERRRRTFDVPLDHQLSRGFQRTVHLLLPDIEYGTTASYGELAEVAGAPRASRAVGTACARNPIPVIVPCHRVVRADGSAGGYAGGQRAKAALLALEQHSVGAAGQNRDL